MMIQPRLFFYGILLCIVFAFSTSAAATTRMPEFLLPNVLDGKSLSSSSFSGKALFVTFFATWCPPCIEEVPTLIKLQAKYGKDDFSVIGLSVDQGGAKVVKKLVEKKSINYPVVLATAQTMQDFGGVYGIPVSFLINKKGNVVKKYTGYVSLSVLEKDLKKIL
ncbi:MAG: TlpA disulfide reductase family protein [Desulfopila sp.]|jgi:thiol-disulfide isomerase/thioredoxin|nr:TlpA disulfide reductase family protein [Desulfopila sp.]